MKQIQEPPTVAGGAAPARIIARAASIHIDDACNVFLGECFRPFGIQLVPLQGEPAASLQRQKFEACLLRLYDPEAERILEAARTSSSNRGMVIYGIARNTREALLYSRYGINAVFDEPLDRQSVQKVIRSSHLLVMNELRRYARVPVVGQVVIDTAGRSVAARTMEVSSGGMSVRSSEPLSPSSAATVTIELPGTARFTFRAQVWWARSEDGVFGLRFDPTDDRRLKVREWIEDYLNNV
ncbi:MAG TPA: PilZ domain-containing protein [Candidatus Angelobacter sp.]|nr:PilZ domain-containing protein [Candidatus Angelobacter sp.]